MNAFYEITVQYKSPFGIATHLVRGIPLRVDPARALKAIADCMPVTIMTLPMQAAFQMKVMNEAPLLVALEPIG